MPNVLNTLQLICDPLKAGDTSPPITLAFSDLDVVDPDTGLPTPVPFPGGTTARCQIRNGRTRALIYEWSSANGQLSVVNAVITLAEIAPVDTTVFPPGVHSLELEVTSNGAVFTYLDGRLIGFQVIEDECYAP